MKKKTERSLQKMQLYIANAADLDQTTYICSEPLVHINEKLWLLLRIWFFRSWPNFRL